MYNCIYFPRPKEKRQYIEETKTVMTRVKMHKNVKIAEYRIARTAMKTNTVL